jgi:hypothetical protein
MPKVARIFCEGQIIGGLMRRRQRSELPAAEFQGNTGLENETVSGFTRPGKCSPAALAAIILRCAFHFEMRLDF